MKKTLAIEGMTCNHCVAHVRNALEMTSGVSQANVDLKTRQAIVEGDRLDDTELSGAVAEAGYKVTGIS